MVRRLGAVMAAVAVGALVVAGSAFGWHGALTCTTFHVVGTPDHTDWIQNGHNYGDLEITGAWEQDVKVPKPPGYGPITVHVVPKGDRPYTLTTTESCGVKPPVATPTPTPTPTATPVPPKATPTPPPPVPPAPPPHRFTRSKVVRVASIIDYWNPDPPAHAAGAGPRVRITVAHPGMTHGLQTFRRHVSGGRQVGACSWFIGQRLRKTASGRVVGGKRVTKRHAAAGTFAWVPRRGAVMRVYLFNGRYFTRPNIQGHYGIGVSCRVRVKVAARAAARRVAARAAAVNPWRRVFNARVRLRTFRDVEHACQRRAQRLTFQTGQPVLCENPDPSQYALFNTGWRRCEIQGWYDVAWQDGPQKGMIFRYSRWIFYKGGVTANPKRTGSFPWDGPNVIQRPRQ
jgi:hypothetical protein